MPGKTALHEVHERAGAQFESWCGWEVATAFSDPGAEYEALRRGTGILDVGYAGKLRFTGRDRIRFLNNMLTNDIRKLEPGTGCYAALLTRQGLMESDLWVYVLPDELRLEAPPCATEQVIATLAKHIVSERVDIDDATRKFGILSIQGPGAPAAIEAVMGHPVAALPYLGNRMIAGKSADWLVVRRDRAGSGGFDVWIPSDDLEQAWRALAAAGTPVGRTALNWARTEAGIPWYGVDMDNRNLPMEFGLESAISLDKGCYRGQEIVARVTYRGKLDRGWAAIAVNSSEAPRHGDEITVQQQKAGVITSAAFSPVLGKPLALAIMRKSFAQPGTTVAIRSADAETSGIVVALPVSP